MGGSRAWIVRVPKTVAFACGEAENRVGSPDGSKGRISDCGARIDRGGACTSVLGAMGRSFCVFAKIARNPLICRESVSLKKANENKKALKEN